MTHLVKFTKRALLLCFAALALTISATAQSQAINAQIEGVVTDSNGGAIPNASVKAVNTQTGIERTVASDESGVYRIPLLPLGTYRVTAEVNGFKKLVRDGITLVTGQIATINLELQAGGVNEEVTITADSPIADAGKIDLGRVMNASEVQNLPLISRNPYNFALLQANVTGRPNAEFGVPRINANGYARRTNYQLDGNSNTQVDRGGIRLMPISETFVSEVQLVTNGFSAEFGGTPGLIMNAVTPSGTNNIHGSAAYRFRRTSFYSRPFFYTSPNDLPTNHADIATFAIGGPIVKDRWHYYGGYEYVKRDLQVEPQRLLSISAANQAALVAAGVPATAFPAAIPAAQKVNFFILRTDAQLNDANRFSARYNYFNNKSPDNIAGGINTLQRSIDFLDLSYSLGAQLVTTISNNALLEFRFQYAKRNSRNERNANSGTGPSVVIAGIANFGSPENGGTIVPLETTTQFLENFTLTSGAHTMKFGGGVIGVKDTRRNGVFARYTFPNVAAYVAARNGTNLRGYTNYVEAFGNPNIKYNSSFYNFFAQDDWKVTRRLKLNYGVRYDLYDVPNADANAPFAFSRNFKIDKNNLAPRLGMVYALREGNRPTVLRASAGLYYEAPFIDLYQRALINNGSPRFFNFTFAPGAAGAPAFPTTLGSLPAGSTLPVQSIETIAPDFEVVGAFHTNVQLEQALSSDYSFTIGYIRSRGNHLPVYRSINRALGATTLSDGRPIFNATQSTRFNTAFNNILVAESGANSDYNAATFQLAKRFSKGYQFSMNYTLSKATDDAPEQNLVALVQGNLVLSDPTSRSRDKGPSVADQRHTFIWSFVGEPNFKFENKALRYILNGNKFGVITTANSGETFNIVSNLDLNLDGFIGSDRPLGIGRNSGRTPNQFNIDLRHSRVFKFNERYKLEVTGEFVNILNRYSLFQVNGTVTTDATGTVTGGLPNFFLFPRAQTALDSRQFQLGFKFIF